MEVAPTGRSYPRIFIVSDLASLEQKKVLHHVDGVRLCRGARIGAGVRRE